MCGYGQKDGKKGDPGKTNGRGYTHTGISRPKNPILFGFSSATSTTGVINAIDIARDSAR